MELFQLTPRSARLLFKDRRARMNESISIGVRQKGWMSRLILIALLGPSLAYAKTLDRSFEPAPLIVRKDTDMSGVDLIDNNPSRPAVIVVGATFKLRSFSRDANGVVVRASDPPLDNVFDTKQLPKQKIDFSHHDFARAGIVAMGSFHVSCEEMHADTCVLVLAESDGTYGEDSTLNLGRLTGFRHGVLATGQKNLTVNIQDATAALWPDEESGPGHAFYANEARYRGEHMRLLGCKLRIGKSRAVAMSSRVRVDHVTAKFKGAWDVDYECLDDENPCGALDEYDSSGTAKINWRHPGGDSQCGIFIAFRCGDGTPFGKPNGKFFVSGHFDTSLAPDPSVRALALHMKQQTAFFKDVELKGKAKPDLYGGLDGSGLTLVSD